jgi:hypothetical protein
MKNHGGKRQGAGRKQDWPEKKITTGLALSPEAKQCLDDQDGSNSSIVERLIRQSEMFKKRLNK